MATSFINQQYIFIPLHNSSLTVGMYFFHNIMFFVVVFSSKGSGYTGSDFSHFLIFFFFFFFFAA